MTSKKLQSNSISPEFALLGLLRKQPAHGYDLHERITQELGQIWHISLSQTYSILNRLEAKGYITSVLQEQEKLPSRRRFRLTPTGQRHLERWLTTPTEPSGRLIRVEFLTRLYFTFTTMPEVVRPLIESQTAEIQARLSHLKQILAELPPEQTFNRLGLELRIHQLNSLVDWMAECCNHLIDDQANKS